MANQKKSRFGTPIDTDMAPEVASGKYASIREMAAAHIRAIAQHHGVDDAIVRDIISGKETDLKRRKKELEQAGNE